MPTAVAHRELLRSTAMPRDYHNKGQEDESKDKYEPPHGILEDLATWSDHGMDKIAEDNGKYNEGWRHSRDQRDKS